MIPFSEGAAVEPVLTCEFCKDMQDELSSSNIRSIIELVNEKLAAKVVIK